MLETTVYEARRRLRGTIALTVGVSVYTAFIVWYFTLIDAADFEDVIADFPPAMVEAFGIENLGTIEGFLGGQIFTFVFLLGLGLYFAYAAASLIAGDLEGDRLDLLLSFPISRRRLVLEKAGTILVPMLLINVVVAVVIYGLVVAIGETIDVGNLVLVHTLSIPYFLVCASIGLVCSVMVDRVAIAERAAIGIVFVSFLVESVVGSGTDYAWIAAISPTNYYEPTTVLLEGTVELVNVGVLLVAALVLLAVAAWQFGRRDL